MSSSAVTWSDITETPNLDRTKIVFTSGSTVIIHAPAGRVFEILTAFHKYGEWNAGCPTVSFQEGDKIGVGAVGTMHVKKEGQEKAFKMPAKILELNSTPERHTLAWQGMLLPTWVAMAERVQVVTSIEDGKACEVKQWESMAGWASYIFKHAMGIQKQLDDANSRFSDDLKAYAENLSGGS